MTIKARIISIGILAVGTLCLSLFGLYALEFSRYRQQQQITAVVAVARGFSALVHELQKERGMSAGFLATPSPEQRLALIKQQARTDLEVAAMVGKNMPLVRLLDRLPGLRERILTEATGHLEAHQTYSRLIQDLLDQVEPMARRSEHAMPNDDLTAHVQLMFAKEYLGRIRAKINHALRTAADGSDLAAEVASLHAVFAEYERQFRRDAAAETLAEYDRIFQGPEIDTTLQIVRTAAKGELARSKASADEWFRLATLAIDRLKKVEDRSLAITAAKNDNFLHTLRQRLLIYTIGGLLLGGLILTLITHTVRGILRSLGHLLTEIDLISEQQDFSRRIPLRTHDEIGIITQAFNELLGIAEQLFKDKDNQAGTDHLTGIMNRRRFTEFLDREMARRQRHAEPLSLIMFDIDHFKRVNDVYGHEIGDLVLREMAQLVGSAARRTDILARWGGEEFVILLPGTTGEAATGFAEKLRATIESHDFPQIGRATASFGVASLEEKETDGTTLIKHADQAMYTAKQDGRNRVVNQWSDYPSCRIWEKPDPLL
ncbi:MAG: diguanylate cyclase [Desulfurivibrionaceae bacterium]